MKRFLLFALLSTVIFEARGATVVYAVVAAAVAALVALRLPRLPTTPIRVDRALRFVPWFFRESLMGGLDVAVRAFRGRAALQPGFIDYPLRLRQDSARVVFANAVSLMPGTFTAQLHDDAVRVHALDTRAALLPRLRALEDRVLSLFPESAG
jgi:multicomponent Na+:H+ antiporter subunit E